MRILHTADWHLGRIFYRKHLTDDQAHVLAAFVDLVRHEKPDAVIVAGDIYDRAVPPPDAVRLLDDVVSELVLGLGVPLIMISGNHDSPGRLGYGSRMLRRQGLHMTTELMASPQPVTLDDDHGPVDFWCLPFAEPSLVRQTLGEGCTARTHHSAFNALVDSIDVSRQALPQPAAGRRSILVGHLHAEGGEDSESERPLVFGASAVVGLDHFRSFDYVALGHLHRPQYVGTSTQHVRYSGSILKYSFSEANDVKGVTMVELDATGQVRTEEIPLHARRDVRRITGAFDELLSPAHELAGCDDYLEITLDDETPIVDATNRLRDNFPNLLHVRRPKLEEREGIELPDVDHREANIESLFVDFYEKVTGAEPNALETAALAEILDQLDADRREVRIAPDAEANG